MRDWRQNSFFNRFEDDKSPLAKTSPWLFYFSDIRGRLEEGLIGSLIFSCDIFKKTDDFFCFEKMSGFIKLASGVFLFIKPPLSTFFFYYSQNQNTLFL